MELSKQAVIKGFIEKFKSEHSALTQSAKAAHLAATHEESRAEDRHDTFAIEASYLAAGQATRVADLEKCISELEGFLTGGTIHTQIKLGSLVEYLQDGKKTFALISVHGGGTKIEIQNQFIQLLSLRSPLGEMMEGTKVNEQFEMDVRGIEKKIQITQIK